MEARPICKRIGGVVRVRCSSLPINIADHEELLGRLGHIGRLKAQLRGTEVHWLDAMDRPDGPPEPVAQVRVLPGAQDSAGPEKRQGPKTHRNAVSNR
jgi:hypothetical protein